MGSTPTLSRHQKSVKFHIDEKPSIKITVSSDALAETILKNNVSASGEDDDSSNGSSQQSALIQIVGDCCSDGVSTPNGALCKCANGDDKRTRIALDDFTVLEFPNCIDFGIKDFLCCKDEIELDLSSDTEASYLDATPPHRFSDSELENQIEAMSITLDTQLNPFPNKSFLLMDSENPIILDDDEEETTEESFIMDEEEVSSSASNSAATICGGGDLELDEYFYASSSDLVTQHEQHGTFRLNKSDSADDALQESISSSADGETENAQSTHTTITSQILEDTISAKEKNDDEIPEIGKSCGEGGDSNNEESVGTEDAQQQIGDDGNSKNRENRNLAIVEKEQVDSSARANADKNATTGNTNETKPQADAISRKMLKHPTKHFKRQISLPASIFMSYLIEQNNKANYCKQQQNEQQNTSDNLNHHHHNREIIVKNKLNRSNSCTQKNNKANNGIMMGMRPPLSKINSYRSAKVIHGSTEDYDDDDINNSNSFSDTNEDFAGVGVEEVDGGGGIDDEEDNSLLGCNKRSNWVWESKSDSFTETDDNNTQEEYEDEQQAFTSEVEKRSLILRHVRRLIRQDTTGNFAPPDFSI